MKKVIITGANGFLGKQILKKIDKQEFDVYSVISGRNNIDFDEKVHIVKADLQNTEETKKLFDDIKADICIHLAWDQADRNYRNASTNIRWHAISLWILQCFIESGGKYFLFASSSAEYEEYSGVMTENILCNKKKEEMSLYGQCKKAFTEIALNYCKRMNTKICICRYFTIYGENDKHFFGAIPSTILAFMQHNRVICNAPNTIIDYIYVNDAAEITIQLIKNEYEGIINVGSGVPHRMRDVFSLIADKMGCSDLIEYNEENDNTKIMVADIKEMKEQFPSITLTNFDEGIERTINWWKESRESSEL